MEYVSEFLWAFTDLSKEREASARSIVVLLGSESCSGLFSTQEPKHLTLIKRKTE